MVTDELNGIADAERTFAPTGLEFAFLQRLASLVRRQDRAANEHDRTILAHAAFSTYLDCAELGLGDQAERILTRDPVALLLWRRDQSPV